MVDWVREEAAAQVGRERLRPCGEVAPPRVTADGVDEHDADRLVWMRSREQPDQQPAVGMPDQHVRRLDPGAVEQRGEILDLIARVVHAGSGRWRPDRPDHWRKCASSDRRPAARASSCWRNRRSPLRAAPSDSRSPRTPHTGHARRHRPPHPTRSDPTPTRPPRQCDRDFGSLARVIARRAAAAEPATTPTASTTTGKRATGHRA